MTTQLPEARFVSAMSSINPFKHTAATLNYLRRQSPEVILFYSGGKDSLVLLDLMAPHFRKIYCVFMYLIKDLDHIQPFMSWVKRYNNAELYQYPHWILAHYLKSNFYCIPRSIDAPPIKIFKMADIEEKVRQKTGCEWIVYGNKQADSLNRRLMLRQYKFDAINEKNKKAYPLSL